MGKNLEIVHPKAAGIDIGSQSFYVDAGQEQVRVFPTYYDLGTKSIFFTLASCNTCIYSTTSLDFLISKHVTEVFPNSSDNKDIGLNQSLLRIPFCFASV